jgi:hypothetical protein
LSCYFYVSFQNLKKAEALKIKFLYSEISSEKEAAHQLKNVPKKVEELNKSTNNKLLKIKVVVFNFDFSFNEIF